MKMRNYELKKVFTRTSNKIAFLLFAAVLVLTCYFAVNVGYVNENGETEKGFAAVHRLRSEIKEWAGPLTEEKIALVINENARINATPEGRSDEQRQSEIAYSWKQGISDIRHLLNNAFSTGFRDYDYYRADSLTAEDAANFYPNRIKILREWLDGEAKDQYSDAEKAFFIEQFEKLETPLRYDYSLGWHRLFEFFPTIVMIGVMILGYMVAGIFSCEFSWKSDAIFYSSSYGRNKAVLAKIEAGFCIVSVFYWGVVLLYTGVVLLYLGADGANCPIQADTAGWKSFHNIAIWQEYLLIVIGGYIGCLFMSFLTMLVSAKARSAVPAVIVPFGLIFLPSFMEGIGNSLVSKMLGLLPDRLLQIGNTVKDFSLYKIFGKETSAIPILLTIYVILTFILLPVLYRVYARKQIG